MQKRLGGVIAAERSFAGGSSDSLIAAEKGHLACEEPFGEDVL
jgi:hypothetical protein